MKVTPNFKMTLPEMKDRPNISVVTDALEVLDASAEPTITAGTAAQYQRGDKTWQDLAAAVRASVLSGLSTATNAAITAADTILAALGKLQAQISNFNAANITSGTVSSDRLPVMPISKGGTDATDAAGARTKLGAAPTSWPRFKGPAVFEYEGTTPGRIFIANKSESPEMVTLEAATDESGDTWRFIISKIETGVFRVGYYLDGPKGILLPLRILSERDLSNIEAELARKVNKTGDSISATVVTVDNDSEYQVFSMKRKGVMTGMLVADNQARNLSFRAYDNVGDSYKSLVFYNFGSFAPSPDNAIDLGAPTLRFKTIYAGTGTINTSDERKKKDISALDKIKDFFMALNPVKFRFKNGTSGRTHHGLIAQEVETAMTANGLSDMDFAGLIKSPDEENEGEYIYGLRYTEFIPMLIKMVQEQQRRIEALEAR